MLTRNNTITVPRDLLAALTDAANTFATMLDAEVKTAAGALNELEPNDETRAELEAGLAELSAHVVRFAAAGKYADALLGLPPATGTGAQRSPTPSAGGPGPR